MGWLPKRLTNVTWLVTKCFDLKTGLPWQREFTSYTENFEVLKIMNVKGLCWDTATIFWLEPKFELGDNLIMVWGFFNRLCCIWDCGSECILVVVYLVGSGSYNKRYFVRPKKIIGKSQGKHWIIYIDRNVATLLKRRWPLERVTVKQRFYCSYLGSVQYS